MFWLLTNPLRDGKKKKKKMYVYIKPPLLSVDVLIWLRKSGIRRQKDKQENPDNVIWTG